MAQGDQLGFIIYSENSNNLRFAQYNNIIGNELLHSFFINAFYYLNFILAIQYKIHLFHQAIFEIYFNSKKFLFLISS